MPRQWTLLVCAPRVWFKVNFSFLCPAAFRLNGPGHTYAQACSALKAMPTMPVSILAIEGLTYLICAGLSRLGFRQFRMR